MNIYHAWEGFAWDLQPCWDDVLPWYSCCILGSCFKLLCWWAKINPPLNGRYKKWALVISWIQFWRIMGIQPCRSINPLWSWALLGVFGTQKEHLALPAFGWSDPYDWSIHYHLKISWLVGCAWGWTMTLESTRKPLSKHLEICHPWRKVMGHS